MPVRFQVDPDFYDHPKTLGMSDAATALWARAGSYSVAKLLDGFVPEDALALLSRTPEEASGELVRRGLWRRVRGGFKFHQWEDRNLTRARVEADRGYERDKKRRQRATRTPTGDQQANGAAVPPGHSRDNSGTPRGVPPVSVSVSVSESVSGSGQPRGGGPEPPRSCPDHIDQPNPPPCGACADTRRAHDAWDARRRARLAAAPKCRRHRGQLADNCALCRSEALAADPEETR
jgi:hypothetical protein